MVGIRYPRRYRVEEGNAIKVPLHMQTHAARSLAAPSLSFLVYQNPVDLSDVSSSSYLFLSPSYPCPLMI